MVDPQTVLDLIAAALVGVSGIGKVNTYERFFTTEAEFAGFHTIGTGAGISEINSVTITIASMSPTATPQRYGFERITHLETLYEIKLMRGQHDASASQIVLARLARAVVEAFDTEAVKTTFLAAELRYGAPAVTQIGVVGYGPQGAWLVNQAIVQITMREATG